MQKSLFGLVEEETGRLLPSHQELAMVLEVVRIEGFIHESPAAMGRPPIPRQAIGRALVAKSVLNIPTTKDLVERLRIDRRLRWICGFFDRIPSESTFSRAFKDWSDSGILDKVLETRVRDHLGQEVVFHVSHDSTAVPAREWAPKKPKPEPKAKEKPAKRRPKGTPAPPTGQEEQEKRSWQESLSLLPTACGYGVKLGPKGYPLHWRGYKGHASIADGGIPLAFFTTSASVSDMLAAIPAMKMVTERVGQVFYNLFDRIYQGEPIRRTAQNLDQVTIVPPKKTHPDKLPEQLTPDRARRFRNRSAAERFMSDLKENHGGNFVFVRGQKKVHAHLMFGVLSIFALRMMAT